MSDALARRFGARAAVTGLVLAGTLIGAGGLAVADEPDQGKDHEVTVDVEKDVDLDLGKNIDLDVDKNVEVDLGKVLKAKIKLKLGL